MQSWFEDLMHGVASLKTGDEIFQRIKDGAQELGFEYCAFGLQLPYPLTSHHVVIMNNYSPAWQERYQRQNFIEQDPTVLLGRRTNAPMLWCEQLFEEAKSMWEEAQAHGLQHGWSQSSIDSTGAASLLSLSRSQDKISQLELVEKECRMRWLVQVAHLALSKAYKTESEGNTLPELSKRETEVMRWSADGKSAVEVADILNLSKNTVDFHIKNAVQKLGTKNKTAAVVRAVMLGLLF